MATSLIVGSLVWVEDEKEAYKEGTVMALLEGKKAKVRVADVELTADAARLHPRDSEAPPSGVPDMTALTYLHEPGVLDNLARRYAANEIYTYTGRILIALNPFASLPALYGVQKMREYKGVGLGELSPHVFAVADEAYRAMLREERAQSLLVSGESGAGKTESMKLIMQYLAFVGGGAAEGRAVEHRVLQSNPLLEAFGNAKTVRNNNSSRFGKYVDIQFNNKARISGAAVSTYLLERSRVTQIADPERNYHVFYQLCAAATSKEFSRNPEMAAYRLSAPQDFHYLNQSQCYDLPGSSNLDEFKKTRSAMDVVGLPEADQEAVFRCVAACLHLGNVGFAGAEAAELADEGAGRHLEAAAELLRCDRAGLLHSLTHRVISTHGEHIEKALDPAAAHANRDTLAKTLYARLFDWLVAKVNASIGQDPHPRSTIGVLDIYGFESFQQNSFEQFCINLANEKLQQHFNQHVFKMEQEDYEREAISWSYIDFVDNQEVLDLIEKKPAGIIALLDEQCMFPKSTSATLAAKLDATLADNPRFTPSKFGAPEFTIDHYAGPVTYQTESFLEKNKDFVVAEHQALLGASRCPLVAALFLAPPAEEGRGSRTAVKFASMGARFRTQLQDLMHALSQTAPHFIRCVKPNAENKPRRFERKYVLHQLRCGGVLEAVRISRAGYPTRKSFAEFLQRFRVLAPEGGAHGAARSGGGGGEKARAIRMLAALGLTDYQVGKTKVFLRAGQMAELDAKRQLRLAAAARRLQRAMRAFSAVRRVARAGRERAAAVRIQAGWRGHRARAELACLRRAAAPASPAPQPPLPPPPKKPPVPLTPKPVRTSSTMTSSLRSDPEAVKAAIAIQAAWRGMLVRKRLWRLKRRKARPVGGRVRFQEAPPSPPPAPMSWWGDWLSALLPDRAFCLWIGDMVFGRPTGAGPALVLRPPYNQRLPGLVESLGGNLSTFLMGERAGTSPGGGAGPMSRQ